MARLRHQAPGQRFGAPTPPTRRPIQRFAWRRRLATWALPASLLAACPIQAATPLRYQINLTSPSSWWNDFPDRTNLILDNAYPNQNIWSTFDYIEAKLSYGPTNPQLYSVPASSIGSPSSVNQLLEDRGPAVYGSIMNPVPSDMSYSKWATARLMAAANQLIGTHYQHLHLPQFPLTQAMVDNQLFAWGPASHNAVSNNPTLQSTQQLLAKPEINGTQPNPYASAYGMPTPGIDCTDFSAYIYNLALGYQLHSGTGNQVTFSVGSGVGGTAKALVLDSTGSVVTPQFFYGPNFGTSTSNNINDFNGLITKFQPGDLLYIGNNDGIVHVVVWLGTYGSNSDGSPSTVPLVISSHDNTPAVFTTQNINTDYKSDSYGFPILAAGESIETYLPPPGVQILPFTSQNWFFTNFQLAMRLLPSSDSLAGQPQTDNFIVLPPGPTPPAGPPPADAFFVTPPTSSPPAVPAPAAPLGLLALIGQRCRKLRRRLKR